MPFAAIPRNSTRRTSAVSTCRALAAALVVAAFPVPLRAQAPVTVAGTILRPVPRATVPVGGVRFVLHGVGQNRQGPVDSVRTGRDGAFRLTAVPDTAVLFLVSARHGGVEFFAERSIVTPSISYTLPQGHLLALTIQRGDSLNDWLIVRYDKTDYDSYVTTTTSDFISVDEVHFEDSDNVTRTAFSDVEDIFVSANVSDPFGSYDIQGANVTVSHASNHTIVASNLPMTSTSWDASAEPRWSVFERTLSGLGNGTYEANVTALDFSGSPSWLNTSFTVLSADHFGVVAPAQATAGIAFSLTVNVLDPFESIMIDWAGTITTADECVT